MVVRDTPSSRRAVCCRPSGAPASAGGAANLLRRIATHRHASASVECAAFETRTAHGNFARATDRSGNISRSSGICCALRSIASNSQSGSWDGEDFAFLKSRNPHISVWPRQNAESLIRSPTCQPRTTGLILNASLVRSFLHAPDGCRNDQPGEHHADQPKQYRVDPAKR